jgi:hypothetical protein
MRRRSLLLIVILALTARTARSQRINPAARVSGSAVSGLVTDSLGRTPLAGAWVQLVVADGRSDAPRTAQADSLGHYVIDDVPDGRYMLGFFHPLLDSLGVEAPLRDVTVRRRAVRVDLAVPSGATLAAAVCGQHSGSDGGVVVAGGTVVGVVRDARTGSPAEGVSVIGEWLEISFTPGNINRRRPRISVSTGANGWFALCNVPAGGTMFVSASRDKESTDLIELSVPKDGFARRDLYLGPARVVAVGDTTTRTDSAARPTRQIKVGDIRLHGSVVAANGNHALSGALVRISDGLTARADARGEWTMTGAPAGTRVLEVRAVGFYPERRAVDVVPDAIPVQVALATFQSVLETVRITAAKTADIRSSGFEDRRRTGMGTYLTAEDLLRRGVMETSDVFKNMPGVRLETDSTGERRFLVRSAFGGYCEPTVYIDGMRMFTATADELDTWVRAKNVRAIEVYNEGTAPPEFQLALSGCGAIVIWTK